MTNSSIEAEDAQRVNEAIAAIKRNEDARAEALLLAVVSRAPTPYAWETATGEALHCRFWDQDEFIHYATLMRDEPSKRMLVWVLSAYPRAYFYLGFLRVKARQFEEAIIYLDAGAALEPNAKFACEKGQALTHVHRIKEALACYRSVGPPSPRVTTGTAAIALRGEGFVLIELGDLEAAAEAFHRSLALDPSSPVARDELDYIARIRQGGRATHNEVVTTQSASFRCSRCGEPFQEATVGRVGTPHGPLEYLCSECAREPRWGSGGGARGAPRGR